MESITAILICVVLPISIVLINALSRINADNKRTQILIKAIESNNSLDTDKLAASLEKPRKSAKEILNRRLLNGCIFTFLGIASAICSTVWLNVFNDVKFSGICFLACAFSFAIGLGFLVTYFVTRKDKE